LKIGILSNNKREWHVKWLIKELENRDAETYVFPVTKLVSKIGKYPKISFRGYPIEDFDSIIVRRVPGGSSEQVFYRMDAIRMLEQYGVYVINSPKSIETAVNKYYTSALLEKAGVNTPKTIVTESFSQAMKAFDELGGDVLIKPIFGSLGMGITRLSDKNIAYRVFRALEVTQSVYYLQEFIQHKGEDIRSFVIGNKVIAAMKRVSKGWKTNISSGGKAEKYEPKPEVVEMSLRAAEAIGLEYSGVDLIESPNNGLQVIELNSTPGWEGLQSVSDVNITRVFVDHLLNKVTS
jgi:RimK family alpha-L-glutamate ligase